MDLCIPRIHFLESNKFKICYFKFYASKIFYILLKMKMYGPNMIVPIGFKIQKNTIKIIVGNTYKSFKLLFDRIIL